MAGEYYLEHDDRELLTKVEIPYNKKAEEVHKWIVENMENLVKQCMIEN